MHKLPRITPPTGDSAEIENMKPSPNSGPSTIASESAAAAIEQLFGWCRMPDDIGDPKVYLAGAVGIVGEYPKAVGDQLADPRTGTRVLSDFPTLSAIRKACELLAEPFEREAERERARDNAKVFLARPKRSPEQQARIDAQVAKARHDLRIPEGIRHEPPKMRLLLRLRGAIAMMGNSSRKEPSK